MSKRVKKICWSVAIGVLLCSSFILILTDVRDEMNLRNARRRIAELEKGEDFMLSVVSDWPYPAVAPEPFQFRVITYEGFPLYFGIDALTQDYTTCPLKYWEPHIKKYRRGFEALRKYVKDTGRALVPDGEDKEKVLQLMHDAGFAFIQRMENGKLVGLPYVDEKWR